MRVLRKSLCIFGLGLALVGCASAPSMTDKPSGFLPNYTLLQPVKNPPKNMQVYTYQNPNVKRSNYHSVIVAPVRLYQTATDDGITQEQITAARKKIQQGVMRIVGKEMDIADKPGPGVAKLQVAITGAELDDTSLKPRNLIPVSAALLIVSKATGYQQKYPVMVVELKITDSQSGKVLREVLTSIKGDEFRNKADINTEFVDLATTWVQKALQYSKQHP